MDSIKQKRVSRKIFLLAFAIAALILVNGSFSFWQMSEVKGEFFEVAHRDLPISNKLSPMIDKQYEQVLLLERLQLLEHEHKASMIEFLYKRFRQKSENFENSFTDLEIFVREQAKGAEVDTLEELTKLQDMFANWYVEYKQFHQQADDLFRHQSIGDEEKIDLLIVIGNELSQKLVAMRNEIQTFTLQSVKMVERHEAWVIQAVVIFTLFAYSLGLMVLMLIRQVMKSRDEAVEKIIYHATYDTLTELFNRRHFFERLSEAIQIVKRYRQPLSLCVCDLDHFKQVNDQKGHQTGDKVLTVFGEIINEEKRETDIAGRFGGDEFVICFVNTSAENAAKVLERIRVRLESFPFKDSKGQMFKVTSTFGVAELEAGQISEESLLEAADAALYSAKEKGRNQVVSRLAE